MNNLHNKSKILIIKKDGVFVVNIVKKVYKRVKIS